MRLTFHQLRLLLTVSREGTVSRAAQRLHLAQPTLSAQLRQLADQVRLPLFERIGRRLHLTAAGKLVVETAERLEQELETLDERLAIIDRLLAMIPDLPDAEPVDPKDVDLDLIPDCTY